MEPSKPSFNLASKVLPAGLCKAIVHVFTRIEGEAMLVGGTALAGFYAAHRSSDDMDIFTQSPQGQEQVVRAVKSLGDVGAIFDQEKRTPSYYRATLRFMEHVFTADVVLDPHLFKVGRSVRLENGIVVADFTTLLMMKTAALVSRCSEKDLYDLIWILDHHPEISIKKLIELGCRLDGGLDPESLLIGLTGAKLKAEACRFSLNSKVSSKKIYQQIDAFRKGLIKQLIVSAKNQPVPPIGELIGFVKRLL